MADEIMKCHKPNNDLPMCRECKRSTKSNTNEYESYNLRETRMNGMQCDGYVSKKESGGLFND